MAVFATTCTVTVAGTTLYPSSVTIAADETWSPYYQGTIVFGSTLTTALLNALDPRTWPKIRVSMLKTDADGSSNPVTLFDGYVLVRSYNVDPIADTVTLRVSSGEGKLLDYANAGGDYVPGTISANDMVTYALNKIGELPNVVGISATFNSPASTWSTGQTLDQWLDGSLRGANGVLWNRPEVGLVGGSWIVSAADQGGRAAGQVTVVEGVNLVRATYGIDIERSGWADAAVAVYQWTAGGAQQKRVYSSIPAGAFHRTLVNNYSTPDPGYDPSPSMRVVAGRRGFLMNVDMLADTFVLTGYQVTVTVAGVSYRGFAQKVTWNYPDDTISLELANTIKL